MPQHRTGEAQGFSSSKLSVLRKHPIFADLEPDAFDQLCRYAKHATLKRGASLFSRGDPGISLYAVISGTVKMSISSPDGRNAILNIIGLGASDQPTDIAHDEGEYLAEAYAVESR